MSDNLVLNIPHCSTSLGDFYGLFYPQLYRTSSIAWNRNPYYFGPLNEKKRLVLNYERLIMTDWYTDELFDNGKGQILKAEISRLVCDMERFEDDEDEPMAQKGMGVCYMKGFDGQPLKNVDEKLRLFILEKYYRPYHARLTELVEKSLSEFGSALILDCHSFHPIPLPYEGQKPLSRPNICIGTDLYHTPSNLAEGTICFFKNRGYSVDINNPYAGTIVPIKYLHKNENVRSIMIELNRGLYLKRGTNEKNERFDILKQHIKEYEEWLTYFR